MTTPASIEQTAYRTRPSRIGLSMLLCLSVVLISACASSQPDEADGKSLGRQGAESNTSLGLEYMNRGQYEIALGKLKKAIKADPSYAPGHTVLAVLYERIGEMDLAGKHYRLAYNADPSDGGINNNYGVYLCQTGERKQAMVHMDKALDDPFYGSPAVALTNAGSCALNNADPVTADSYLRRALKIDPNFPDALLLMARLNFEEQNLLKSRAFMQRFEAVSQHGAASLLLAYKVESASHDERAAQKYKLMLETSFPETDQAAEVRRLSKT